MFCFLDLFVGGRPTKDRLNFLDYILRYARGFRNMRLLRQILC